MSHYNEEKRILRLLTIRVLPRSDNAVRRNSSALVPPSPPGPPPRASSSQSPTNGHIPDASSLFASPVDSVTQAQLENQQRTISLLVSEKATLSTTLQNLESEAERGMSSIVFRWRSVTVSYADDAFFQSEPRTH